MLVCVLLWLCACALFAYGLCDCVAMCGYVFVVFVPVFECLLFVCLCSYVLVVCVVMVCVLVWLCA